MTPPQQALLQQLHDIHLPVALSRWDLAPGWYLILGLLILMVLGGIAWTWRWYHRGKVKRAALRLLVQYEQSDKNNAEIIAAINELLKRVALVYFPREQVAALYGQDWLKFLQDTSRKLRFLEEGGCLISGPYQESGSTFVGGKDPHLHSLFHLARGWIAQRRKPCLS